MTKIPLQFFAGQRAFVSDLNNLALINENAVRSGCQVIQNTIPDMSVIVSAGTVFFGLTDVPVIAQNVAIAASDPSFDRIDLVVVNNSGTASIITGVPAADPTTPSYVPQTFVVLARVLVQDLAVTILNADISDLRVFNIINAGVTPFGKVAQGFAATTTTTVVHNLSDSTPQVQVYDNSVPPKIIIPAEIQIDNANQVTVTFTENSTGTVIVHGGQSTPQTQSFIFNQAIASTSWLINHNLAQSPVLIQVYDTTGTEVLPDSILLNSLNQATISFASAQAGDAIIRK